MPKTKIAIEEREPSDSREEALAFGGGGGKTASGMEKDPKPIRNALIALTVATAIVIGAVAAVQARKEKAANREDARLYEAITNEVFRVGGREVERVAPLRQFLTRRSWDHIMFKSWVEMSSTGGPIRRELEVSLKANYLTSGAPEVVSVRIKDIIR